MPGWPTRRCRAWSCPRGRCSPTAPARAGRLQVPARPDLVFDFLKVEWRTIQHYGVEIGGLRYDGPALNGYRNRTSPLRRRTPGSGRCAYDPDDVTRVWFQDPDDDSWHELAWEHADALGAPFSAEALAYARRLVAAEGGTSMSGGRWPSCWSGGTPGWSATRPSGGWRSAPPSSAPPGWPPPRPRRPRPPPCPRSRPGRRA